jgi:hypothetical protein
LFLKNSLAKIGYFFGVFFFFALLRRAFLGLFLTAMRLGFFLAELP